MRSTHRAGSPASRLFYGENFDDAKDFGNSPGSECTGRPLGCVLQDFCKGGVVKSTILVTLQADTMLVRSLQQMA
jgi:hypothetical protein